MVLYLLAHFFKASTLKVPWLSEWLVLLNQTLYSSLFNSDWGSIRVFLQPIAQSEYLLFFHDYFIGFWYELQISWHWNRWTNIWIHLVNYRYQYYLPLLCQLVLYLQYRFKEYTSFLLILVDLLDLGITKDITFCRGLKAIREILKSKDLLGHRERKT